MNEPEQPPSQDTGVLKIGDRTFAISTLGDDCQRLVLAIKDCDEQSLRIKRQLNYLEIARRSLIQELLQLLPSD